MYINKKMEKERVAMTRDEHAKLRFYGESAET